MATFEKWLTGLPADATVADAARVAVASRAHEVAERLPLAAGPVDHAAEHVHQVRVAARRTAAVIETFGVVFPDKQSRRLVRAIKHVRRAAGPARDLDVLLQRLREEGRLPGLQGRLYAQREEAQMLLVRAAKDFKGGKQIVKLAARLVRHTPLKSKRARRTAKQDFDDWAAERLSRAAKRFAKAAPPLDAEPAQLHEFRIAAKRMRYALEVLAVALTAEQRELAYARLKALQDRLGALNDQASAADRLCSLAADAADVDDGALGQLVRNQRDALKVQQAEFRAWWSPEAVGELRELLRGRR